MKYFFIETAGDLGNLELCYLDDPPQGLGLKYYKMAEGSPIGKDYPKNAEIKMSDEHDGIALSTLIGHSESYLVLHLDAINIIKELCTKVEIEYLPFTLINHRGRPHSSDYFIVNPIGGFDCMDLESSDIDYYKKKILDINKFVLDAKKLDSAPALFRIPEDPSKYVINEELATAFQSKGFTNIFLTEIEQK